MTISELSNACFRVRLVVEVYLILLFTGPYLQSAVKLIRRGFDLIWRLSRETRSLILFKVGSYL